VTRCTVNKILKKENLKHFCTIKIVSENTVEIESPSVICLFAHDPKVLCAWGQQRKYPTSPPDLSESIRIKLNLRVKLMNLRLTRTLNGKFKSHKNYVCR